MNSFLKYTYITNRSVSAFHTAFTEICLLWKLLWNLCIIAVSQLKLNLFSKKADAGDFRYRAYVSPSI